MMARRLMLCGTLGSFLFVQLFCNACGKKADPVPSKLLLPPVIADLNADSVEAGIRLSWSVPASAGSIATFRILRGEMGPEQACLGCPREHRPVATLKIDDRELLHRQGKAFHYTDAAVGEGLYYSYRISACDSRGLCGEPSVPVQHRHEK